jgi:hypothetical protein
MNTDEHGSENKSLKFFGSSVFIRGYLVFSRAAKDECGYPEPGDRQPGEAVHQ